MLPIFHAIVDQEEHRETNLRLRMKRRGIREEMDLATLNDERFKELFRVDKDLFNFLCNRLTPHLREPKYQSGVTIQTKILVALRYYAIGCYQRSLGGDFNLGVSQTMAHRCIHEVTNAISVHLHEFIHFPTTRREMDQIKEEFMEKFGFPGVIGCIDGTHIAILKPTIEEHNFINRKGFHSLNVQIVCDATLKILSVNATYPGATHDSFIWRNSRVKDFLMNQYNTGLRRTWLLGDSGYHLQPVLMIPFLNPNEGSPESRYNRSHIMARNCVERSIGVLKARFRCLLRERVARYSPAFVGQLVNACCILHNLCIQRHILYEGEPFVEEGNQQYALPPIQNLPNIGLREGEVVRRNVVNTYFVR